MTYEILSSFAQTWGMLLFIVLFAGAFAYALWPRNQDRFDRAALAPLNDADAPIHDGANEDRTDV